MAAAVSTPTDIADAIRRDFVTDGYGNARVHSSPPTDTHLLSWGEPGPAPDQFSLPHGVWIDRHGRVLVCDRENDRVQVFDQEGRFQRVWPTVLIGPAVFYVDARHRLHPEHNGGLLSVLTLEGERLAQWGDPASARAPVSGATPAVTSTACGRARGDGSGAS